MTTTTLLTNLMSRFWVRVTWPVACSNATGRGTAHNPRRRATARARGDGHELEGHATALATSNAPRSARRLLHRARLPRGPSHRPYALRRRAQPGPRALHAGGPAVA